MSKPEINCYPDSRLSLSKWLICLIFLFSAGCIAEKEEQTPGHMDSDQTEVEMPENRPSQDDTAGRTASVLGEVPDFEFNTLEGETIRISDYRGQILLLNFWATWCLPCQREIPDLISLREEFDNQGFEILGIALDEEGFEVVKPFLRQFEINYPVVVDDYSYGNKLGGIFMVPTTFIIDREGNIVSRKIGEITKDEIIPMIEPVL